jgi:sulfur carrier protein ThiS adenylyltransferase
MVPGVELQLHRLRLHPENVPTVFADCQVIVEALDASEAKTMLIEAVLCHLEDTYLVAASGVAGYGASNAMVVTRIGRLFLCGDGVSEATPERGLMAPRVMLAAAMQANQVVEILLSPSHDELERRFVEARSTAPGR